MAAITYKWEQGGCDLRCNILRLKISVAAANVSILGVQYNLYTHAHHKYGLNDAFDRSVEILLRGPSLKDSENNVWVRLIWENRSDMGLHNASLSCPFCLTLILSG